MILFGCKQFPYAVLFFKLLFCFVLTLLKMLVKLIIINHRGDFSVKLAFIIIHKKIRMIHHDARYIYIYGSQKWPLTKPLHWNCSSFATQHLSAYGVHYFPPSGQHYLSLYCCYYFVWPSHMHLIFFRSYSMNLDSTLWCLSLHETKVT